jgi:hypothetical protein
VAAAVMVMPRSCSCGIQSIVACALVNLTDLVDLLGVEEDPLGNGRLAGVDMGNDADIARACERNLSSHLN